MEQNIESLNFLTKNQIKELVGQFGSPIFVYSQNEIESKACDTLNFPNAFGLTVRYAMKANPNNNLLKILQNKGIKIDASSEYEVFRAIQAGFSPSDILLTSQEYPEKISEIIKLGVNYNACSLHQLTEFGKSFPNSNVSIRFNPGLGSGETKKTNVGGKTSSFGIWFERIKEVQEIIQQFHLNVVRIHTHIGSGSDPEVWKTVAHHSLELVEQFPTAKILNLGGGYKVGRMSYEKSTNLQKIGEPVKQLFIQFFENHNRKLHLEIEPGSYLMVKSGSLIGKIDDKVDTGENGFEFLKLNFGMDSITRPSLYGAKHPIIIVNKKENLEITTKKYVFVGHCCESGDLITQQEGGSLDVRETLRAEIGDLVVVEGTGAYCSSMSTKNYNSFPEIAEVLLTNNNEFKLIRKRQTLEQIFQNETKVL